MGGKRQLSASLEDYLEAIYVIIQDKDVARPKDVAQHLDVAASSVTNALQGLVKRGLVNHAPYDSIALTERGEELAVGVLHRHQVLTRFFTDVLSVDADAAARCACKMEHAVCDVVLNRLVDYAKFVKHSRPAGVRWVEGTGFVADEHLSEGGANA
ncbi:MAG: metal-dependent transcriptional regulator [Lentisphaerae bacterium]|nr:metal-dependent transcriptional regulator [Lentisphaerota bacterium]